MAIAREHPRRRRGVQVNIQSLPVRNVAFEQYITLVFIAFLNVGFCVLHMLSTTWTDRFEV